MKETFVGILVPIITILFVVICFPPDEPVWDDYYDTSLLSEREMVNVSLKVFNVALKEGIKAKGMSPVVYHVILFGGFPKQYIYESLIENSGKKIRRGTPYLVKYETSAVIRVVKFEHLSAQKLIVNYSVTFNGTTKKNTEAFFEKKVDGWRHVPR